jgi:hypothetical protein
MPKITVQEQKDLTVLPQDTILHLKVDELTIREVDGRNGKWEKLEFKFKILGIQIVGDGSSPELYEDVIASPIWGSVPYRLTESPENKLRQWAEAILGIQMGVGFELDTDLLINRECRGITTQYDKRTTNPVTGQPNKGHQIDSLLPRADVYGQQPQQQWAQPAQQQVNQVNQPQQQALDPWAQPQQPQAQPGWQGQPGQPVPAAWQQPQGQQAWEEPPF